MEIVTRKLILLALLFASLACSTTRLVSLRVEYEERPLGIDVGKPRFSWQMVSSRDGESQSAYQIIVTDEKGDEVWNSGKVSSTLSLNIPYGGRPLQPRTGYNWEVKVWTRHEKAVTASSWFETGLMDTSIRAWNEAKWIGGGEKELVLYPDYLPLFNISYTLRIDQASLSTKAGFIFGANDPRLLNRNRNIYNLQLDRDESYVEVELDISGLEKGETALLNIYRVGYAPGDRKEVPLHRLPISRSLIGPDNRYEPHTITLKTMYGSTECYIDGQEENNRLGSAIINPIGNGWDFITFPQLCEIGLSVGPNQQATFTQIEVANYRVPNRTLFATTPEYREQWAPFLENNRITFRDGMFEVKGGDSGCFVTANIRRKSMPMLRTTFQARKSPIAKARLYITSRGIYQAYINGIQIGDDHFNPGLTQYNKHQMYQTYDVTEHLRPGANAMGVILGEGWWSGAVTYMGYLWNLFGDRQSLLSMLVITYTDGTEESVVSDPRSWSFYDEGPVVYSSFFQGEVYDARKEPLIEGWSESRYDDSAWKKAVEITPEGEITHDEVIEQQQMPAVNDFSDLKLIGQMGPTVKKVAELTAIGMEEVRPGLFVYDMGQNMAGIPHIELKGLPAGKEIRLRFAEVRYPNLPEFQENVGMVMLENIRGAMAQEIYITRGGDHEVIHPRFTLHGYRYVEITGTEHPLPLEAVKGWVLSSIHEPTSNYRSSNPKINRLWENIVWSSRGNFISIPTDCPQRNERMGWSGDISVFSRTATYMGYLPQFLRRHMVAMRDTQRKDGRFADVAPIGGGFGGILWGSAGITVAWESYLQYNDRELLEEHYGAMDAYIDYLMRHIDPETGIMTEGTLGDWLGPEQEKNDNSLLWEAYFIYDLQLMERIATVLGKQQDAARFRELLTARKAFFNRTYIDRESGKTIHSGFREPHRKGETIGTQTSYLLPLAFDICNDTVRERMVDQLLARIEHPGKEEFPPYSLMTGFIGTAWLNRVLSDLGHSETAYRIFQQTSYPSWLYSVDQGATTIWERLNSYTREHGFSGNNSMNSFNHYSFGAIGSWMLNHSAGIERDENEPGFKHFILQPEPDPTGEMTWAKGSYDSPYGRIESEWRLTGDRCNYRFKVPANTTATLYLPAPERAAVRVGNKGLTSSPLLEVTGEKGGKVIMELQPGEHRFTVRYRAGTILNPSISK
ncbi:MAG: family 78 glycoside hydrolase catalytic domain [Petrimonas mucosa]|jgi:alpha-L-rhamnosidase|uniref:family 78 glycoside hydrolase catalytic domain n=1 Tax=Petrimonas mucosa TaxID=1642646 RepID=UPI0023F4F0A7|nr:family 78 glycoside hydrolase catalytic domain [Petrimonas mucosa]MDD3562000.1 family 78 glycoside hydrolase catalytic domain [Petrimonas mucosa]